jgi:diguanylate cyclase (GGDEF)-like protein
MDATSPTDPPAAIGSAAAPRGVRAEFRAVLLYALWAGLALGANALGIATLPASAGLILLAGIALTSALFVGLTRIPGDEQPTALTIIAAQLLMGLIWATLYAYFASGSPLLAAGMYTTAVGFGLHAIAEILHTEKSRLLASNAELQQELERVTRRAERDQLTNSYGRRAILDMLAREKARAERTSDPLCVCLLDIDHFKDMNDRYGHVTGDRILAAFARRVRGALRTMDSVNSNGLGSAMGRVGGEEFIVVLPLTSLRGALRSAERIRKAIVRRPFEGLHQVTVSIGIAELRPGETVSTLIDRADQALYGAKHAGRNRVHCATLDGGPNAIVMPDMSAAG